MKKQIPILMSTMMVQAILAGRKTMTRRTSGLDRINEAPDTWVFERFETNVKGGMNAVFKPKEVFALDPDWKESFPCPYGQPGDILWVRETFLKREPRGEFGPYGFKADMKHQWKGPIKWKPSIHMPKKYARIWLEVTGIRVERLQDISEEDAIAEGVEPNCPGDTSNCPSTACKEKGCQAAGEYFHYTRDFEDFPAYSARESFQSLWEKINGPESWEANRWVWVVSYRILSTTGKPAGLEKEVVG